MLHLNDVTLRIGGRPLLEGASVHLPAGHRVGLVGRNGSGKTTLLRLIRGDLAPDAGAVRLRRGARVGWVAQEAPGGERTPRQAVLDADLERDRLLRAAERARDPGEIGEIHTRLADIGAHAAPARASAILAGLGFDDAAQERPLAAFSGGWRMRVALAAVLFAEPDLLLLDEPTNHLDLEASLWLEDYLCRYPRTLLLISHDRHLLNRVPERIVHLDQRKLTSYTGGYDVFERVRRERLVLLEKERARQEARRRHMQAFVDRFRYKASKARQAQSRLKALARLEPIAEVIGAPDVVLRFPAPAVPPPPLITLERVRAGYGRADRARPARSAHRPGRSDRAARRQRQRQVDLRPAARRADRAARGRGRARAEAPGRLFRPAPDRGSAARADRAAASGRSLARSARAAAAQPASAPSVSPRRRPIWPRACSRAARRHGSRSP